MFSSIWKSAVPEGKILALKPEVPILICQQCHAVRHEGDTCPNCGTLYPPLDQDLPDPSKATLQESGLAPTSDNNGSARPLQHESHSFFSRRYHPIFWGRGQTLLGIFIVNTFYTLLTLGMYSFWGRVRIRQYLNSQTSLAKIRFSYHGTGMELLKGATKALVIFGIPYAFLSFVPIIWEHIPSWIPNTLAGCMVLCFVPIAVVGSHRYRLSRTAFGTIRFSFRGRVKRYMKIWFTGTFLTLLTAGVYYPFFEHARREFLVSHTYLGNRPFTYEGNGTALLWIYAKTLGLVCLIVTGLIAVAAKPDMLTSIIHWGQEEWSAVFVNPIFLTGLLTLFLPWFYLQATKQKYFWNHSTFDTAPFKFTASTWNLLELRVTNFLMLILTFGLAWPWVQVRNLQYLYYYLGLQGPLDLQDIEQDALDASPTGEELAGYFDAGFDLG